MKSLKDRGFSKAHVMSVVPEVVQAINGNFDWSIDPILQDIKHFSNSFDSIVFSYIPRDYNVIAL